MASCNVRWRNSTKKDLRGLPREEVVRVIAAVNGLADDPQPHGSQKLAGSERTYRIRVGDYRVIYEVFGVPTVIKSSVCDIARMFTGGDLCWRVPPGCFGYSRRAFSMLG